ncbi:MAG: heat-inducible transcription repressor HrcA [Magnetococcales bacterium]|nr:heat-inducible transcription repressor HrcA [Magnetococcales bacterium]
MLTQRQTEILRLVVQSHIDNGAPVGSQTVSERSTLSVSPATIRNAMSELESLGLLTQPHRSAGRIPTDQGFRAYVDGLNEAHLTDREMEQILKACETGGDDLGATLDSACQAMASLIPYTCLVRPPSLDEAQLDRIQFVELSENRVLAILASCSGQVQHRIFLTETAYSRRELDGFGDALSRRLEGLNLNQVKDRLEQEVARGERRYRELCHRLLTTVRTASVRGGHLIINGRSNLFGVPEWDDTTEIRGILEMLDEKKKLVELLDHCLHADGVQLFIGSESHLGPARGCSVVAAKFLGPESRLLGTLGVLGPTRLDYAQVIPLVDFTARALSGLLSPKAPASTGKKPVRDHNE